MIPDTSTLETKRKPTEMSRWVKNVSALMISGAVVFASLTYNFNDHEYQIVQLSDYSRAVLLLDKKTGRVWKKYCFADYEGKCTNTIVFDEERVTGLNGYSNKNSQDDMQRIKENTKKDAEAKKKNKDKK